MQHGGFAALPPQQSHHAAEIHRPLRGHSPHPPGSPAREPDPPAADPHAPSPCHPTTVDGTTATAPPGSVPATVSSSVVHAPPTAPASRRRAAATSSPATGSTSCGRRETASPPVTTLPSSARRAVSGVRAARARRDPVSRTRRAAATWAGATTTVAPSVRPALESRTSSTRRLTRCDTGRGGRGERGRDAGAGQRHRVPRLQAERVEHLGVQPDHAATRVGGRRGDPDDEGNAGVEHPATLSAGARVSVGATPSGRARGHPVPCR